MVTVTALARIAALVGDPARAGMLAALMDGRVLTAAELARAASVTPQTASGHLAQLTQAGLLAVARQGRHRYHRLASPAVARMLEGVMAVAAGPPA
ncbi:ArsR/SmtB family transcription factor, partial [Methylobacterium platani]